MHRAYLIHFHQFSDTMAFSSFERAVLLVFFATHIPITLLIDAQAALPASWFPTAVRDLVDWYASPEGFNDSLMRYPRAPWFRSIVTCEVLLQVPFFFLALHGLWTAKHRRCIRPAAVDSAALHSFVDLFEVSERLRAPALLYTAHVVTTMVPILTHFVLPCGCLPLFGGNPFDTHETKAAGRGDARKWFRQPFLPDNSAAGVIGDCSAEVGGGPCHSSCCTDDGASPRQRLVLSLIYAPYLLVPLLLMRIVLREFPPFFGEPRSENDDTFPLHPPSYEPHGPPQILRSSTVNALPSASPSGPQKEPQQQHWPSSPCRPNKSPASPSSSGISFPPLVDRSLDRSAPRLSKGARQSPAPWGTAMTRTELVDSPEGGRRETYLPGVRSRPAST